MDPKEIPIRHRLCLVDCLQHGERDVLGKGGMLKFRETGRHGGETIAWSLRVQKFGLGYDIIPEI